MVLNWKRAAVLMTAALGAGLLVACGGGGNESGDPESLRVFPEGATITGNGTCPNSGKGPDVFVFGGQPPYKLSNTVSDAVKLSTNRLANSGDSFTFTLEGGGCLDNMPIVIEDDMGRLATFSLTVAEGTAPQ